MRIDKWTGWIVVFCLLVGLATPLLAEDQDPGGELTGVVRAFFRALYLQEDPAVLARYMADPSKSAALQAMGKAHRGHGNMAKDIEEIRATSPPTYVFVEPPAPNRGLVTIPVGARTLVNVQFRSSLMAIPMIKASSGWKVDERFFLVLDAHFHAGDPETVVRQFLLALFQKDPSLKTLITSDTPDAMAMLNEANDFPGGDLDQLEGLAEEMTVVRAHDGERFRMPSGQVQAVTHTADHLMVIGMYGVEELPFELRKVEGRWKVVPQPYILMMRRQGDI